MPKTYLCHRVIHDVIMFHILRPKVLQSQWMEASTKAGMGKHQVWHNDNNNKLGKTNLRSLIRFSTETSNVNKVSP